MADSLARSLPATLRKSPARATLRGEGGPKSLGMLTLGPVIERMVALSKLSKEQVADAMGYADASTLSRWISGQENPHLSRIWSVRALRACLLLALAEDADAALEVETTIRVRRLA